MSDPIHTRTAILKVWADQSCRNPADWPDTLQRLLLRHSSRLDAAVVTLTAAFGNGPPDDPLDTVWRAFPPLDPEHRAQLIGFLTGNQRHTEAA